VLPSKCGVKSPKAASEAAFWVGVMFQPPALTFEARVPHTCGTRGTVLRRQQAGVDDRYSQKAGGKKTQGVPLLIRNIARPHCFVANSF